MKSLNANVGGHSYVNFDALYCVHLRSEVDSSVDYSVDGSSTPVRFSYEVEAGWNYFLERICGSIVDTQPLNENEFGSISALTNGCLLQVEDDESNVVFDFLDGQPIKYNHGWSHFAGVDARTSGRGFSMRWTFSKATNSKPLRIPSGYKIVWTVRDNLTTLDECTMLVQGQRHGLKSLRNE